MRTRTVGRTGVRVTELGFGAAPIGNLYRAVDDDTARAAVDAAWEGGVRYFDTAPHYGLGLSERRLGAALADRPREQVVLSTKVGRLLVPNPAPTGSDLSAGMFDVPDDTVRLRDYTADGVRRSLEASMRRLQVDRVDIVLVHDPDDHLDQAAAEALPALARLRDEGVVGAVGVGMNQWQGPLRLLETGLLDVVMLASRWTLLDRTGEALLDAGERHGASVVAAAPYASGLLATPRPVPGATYEYQQAPPGLVERAAAMADRCEAAGLTMPDAALQFALRRDVVSAVLAGLRDADEVAAALARLSTDVPEEVWHDLGA